MAERQCFLGYIFEYSWLSVQMRIAFDFFLGVNTHTFTKSWSCSSTHTVLRRVGYHVSCFSNEGTRKSWLTLSFSLISVPVGSLFAPKKPNKRHIVFMFLFSIGEKTTYQPTHRDTPNPLPLEQNV